jgi:hypothetical protein
MFLSASYYGELCTHILGAYVGFKIGAKRCLIGASLAQGMVALLTPVGAR